MANESTTTIAASANFDKLKAKLRELFELDKADLDFGIYRILRQRHTEITEFLDKHLEKTVREALASHGGLQQAQIEDELHKAEQAASAAGITPEQSPRVMELRVKLATGTDLTALADEVYSHLLTFFSRYYQEGDFLGLHRSTVHGREKYMIPYNGEEVKLIWANMDQYYIKSSELLRDYTFHIRRADIAAGELPLGHLPEEVMIHFKLVEGDTEKDNRKPDGKTTRAFALDDEHVFVEDNETTLTIRFHYREHPAERNLQEKLNANTEKTLADNLPDRWKRLLWTADPTYTGKDKKDTRTLLQKHLRRYTARHQFDYFIHKDLGGFLRRELDFYIKNEIMHLDDIENVAAPKAEEYLSKIRAIRRCAQPVISMLEQLENFQKKLWLKKKFVVETRYCLTLDRVPESLYEVICKNDAQWAEWEQLYALSELPKDMFTAKPRTVEFLKQQPHLMIDTRHFDRNFTLRLLASIDNLDETLDGVCFHAENFQALQSMQERYREQVKCVYIDPPYNTDAGPISYKNGYRSSSWVSLLADRLAMSSSLLRLPGVLCATIDDYQQKELHFVIEELFGKENLAGTVAIRINPSGRPVPSGFAQSHEYAIFAKKTSSSEISKLPRTEQQMQRYRESDSLGAYMWELFRKRGSNSERADRPSLYYPIYYNGKNLRVPGMVWNDDRRIWDVQEPPTEGEAVFYPIDENGVERTWRWKPESIEDDPTQFCVKERDAVSIVYYKFRPSEDGVLPLTFWGDAKYSATEHGTGTLKKYFKDYNVFSYPKSIYAVEDCISLAGMRSQGSVCLDFFAGSGTTGHAVINLNREDNGSRKYILVEMGAYFDTVLVPRLKKVVYSTDWKDGKPQSRDSGISHAFKIVRLEGYEDTLNNLHLVRTPEQQAALIAAPEEAREGYLISYFLDVESAGSASLIDLDQFRDPFSYQLKIATSSAGETKETPIDLVETFNWLLGLKVKQIDTQRGFLRVIGEKRAGGRTLVIWRTLSDDPVKDNKALDQFLARLQINPADTEFAFIYVNGSHTLADPHNKVHLIEETFVRLMFEAQDFETLSE